MRLRLLLYVLAFALPVLTFPLEERKACTRDAILAILKNSPFASAASSFCSEWNQPTVTSSVTLVRILSTVATQTSTSITTVDTLISTTKYEAVQTITAGEPVKKRSAPFGPLNALNGVASSKISSACSCFITSPLTTKVVLKTVATSSSTSTRTATIKTASTATSTVLSLVPLPSFPACTVAADTPAPGLTRVNLRIEGLSTTIFEGNVYCGPGFLTTPSGGNHSCNGQNNGANPLPGATPSMCLNYAAAACGFPFDGSFMPEFDDFSITTIAGVSQTPTQFWGLLNNYQFAPVGGCSLEVKPGDQVLWAFDAFNQQFFLKLALSTTTVSVGQSVTVTVMNGMTGMGVAGAQVAGVTTDATGQAILTFTTPGVYSIKAYHSLALRSNAVIVEVAS